MTESKQLKDLIDEVVLDYCSRGGCEFWKMEKDWECPDPNCVNVARFRRAMTKAAKATKEAIKFHRFEKFMEDTK